MGKKCSFCGEDATLPLTLKPTFSQFGLLQGTDTVCESCNEIYNNSYFRTHNWIQTKNHVMGITRENVLETLISEKELPFRIYLTVKKRRHGWINIIAHWEYDNDIFYVGFDDNKILVEKKLLSSYVELIAGLRDIGITKTELRRGIINYKNIKKLKNFKDTQNKLLDYNNNPLWDLVIAYAI